ncbi:hypothetical protein [Flavobacterium sp.]|uniref:hypothetical protein n=1 Tax=Flavobacterium sp. TaxID=239 RepID=UPI000EEC5375|nr:hypothetical protein [Flavobacterium sp.]HCQ14464.1 hypothetical protein [Flavobacterium sp.]
MSAKIKKQLFFVATILFQTALWAQAGMDDDEGNLEGNDPPAASINDALFWMVIIALLLAYYFTLKKFKTKNNINK